MAHAQGLSGDHAFEDDGWRLRIDGDDSAHADWAATLLALANGAIGVRGQLDEVARASTFLTHAHERTPIAYHERLHGFAANTDTRVPVAEPLTIELRVDGVVQDLAGAVPRTTRVLDLRAGVLARRTDWTLPDGRVLTVEAERLVPLDGRTLLLRRLRATLAGHAVTLHPRLRPAPRQAGPSDDPRIGTALGAAGFRTERADDALVVERLAGSGIAVAAAQRVGEEHGWAAVATGYAVGADGPLAAEAGALAMAALEGGFAAAVAAQRERLDVFWDAAAVAIPDDARLTGALRLNLFHLFASAPRDGLATAAAKGLTGEGYEGHVFWDAEAFMLPVLAMLAPAVARAMLCYRIATLDAAIANARALGHRQGALYAWRTIAGRECSAHYPSGSAQYHINAAVAFAIALYVDATGDEALLAEGGARVLAECARLWLALGDWADGRFHLRGVTGPDEYTALIDDNWYTNRMAQKALRYAADAVRRGGAAALGVDEAELATWTRAADAMHLPYDAARDLDAQDASFLDKPRWPRADIATDELPLLLHYHPLFLYRRQVAKQADLILGLVLGGEEVSRERKARAFAHYEPITTHDSTLSGSSFAILAAELGEENAALRFLADTSFVDLDDQHGNTAHGVHMAACAGSWMALVWGFGGFRPAGERLRFRPTRPAAWAGYRFGVRWRGTTVRLEVAGDQVTYCATEGPAITLCHHDTEVQLAPGARWTGPLAP